VLKPILLVLVGLAITLRFLALVLRLRHQGSRDGLAAEFRRELRRRGLIAAPPDGERHGSPPPRSPLHRQPEESAD